MSNYVMKPEDEYMHLPTREVNFNESAYTNAFDSQRRVGGWMRLGNRVNEGYAELSVCLYLPDGRIACQFKRPEITHNNAFDGGGLTFEVIEPLKKVRMEYAGELFVLDDPDMLRDPQTMFKTARKVDGHARWTHEAVSPIHGGEPVDDKVQTMYGRDFSLGHFNQHSRATGEIRIGDETFAVDGFGWRDHSWGPRYWQAIFYYRLLIGNFDNGDGFMLLKITDQHGHSRRQGVLLVDGKYEEVIDMDVMTEWTGKQDPQVVHIGVRTAERKAIIRGDIITLAPLRNRRKAGDEILHSRIAEGFTEWSWNGAKGYGITEYIERLENEELVGYPL